MDMAKQNDYLQPLLDLMNKRMDSLEQKIDSNTATTNKILDQAKYTNGRVTQAEKDIKTLQLVKGKKFTIPTPILYLIALGAVITLVIVAKLVGADLGGILG